MVSSSDDKNFENIQDYRLNSLDLQIIELLQEDGRAAYSYIAKELDIPEATARYRVKKLIDEEIITIGAFLNTGKLSYANVAYLEMDVNPDFFEGIIEELVKMKNISYISSVTGELNIMFEYVYHDNDELISFLNWIKSKKEVNRLNSKVILKIYKAQYPLRLKRNQL
jgi:Lrp/AsnC family transcriptional regulator for asnA, asnC and gidA